MSLTFVLGRAGSGKSHYIYNRILEEAYGSVNDDYIVVIPEQSSMNTQKALTDLARAHAILNIDVLSFKRLTYRVFKELGITTEGLLDDTAKNLLIRRIISEHESEFSVLTGDIKKMGYVDEIKSLLTEFDEYCLSDEDMKGVIDDASTPLLSAKFSDLLLIKQYFKEKCEAGYITGQGVTEKLASVCRESAYLKDSVIVFDCFTGFTPVQLVLLSELMKTARDIYVLLTLDPETVKDGYPEPYDLFYITKCTYYNLKKIAAKNGVTCHEDIVMDTPFRYSDRSDLIYINKYFLRPGAIPFEGDTPNISVDDRSDIYAEVRAVAERICESVYSKAYRYRDIAVVSPSEEYDPVILSTFEEYGIPVFSDAKSKASGSFIISFVKGFFKIIDSYFSIDSVMSFLRTGLCGVTDEEADDLENYLFAHGINKKYKWEKPWDDEELDVIREKLLSAVGTMKGETVCDLTKDLYDVIHHFKTEEAVFERASELRSNGDIRRAEELEGTYTSLMKLFESMIDFLGDEKVTLDDYEDILYAGLDSLSVGSIPSFVDQVVYGDLTRSRNRGIKIMFLIGASSDKLPVVYGSSGLLSQPERSTLIDMGVSIAPTDREKALTSRLYILNALTAASDRLYISYSHMSSDGSRTQSSVIVQELLKKLTALNKEKREFRLTDIGSYPGLRRYVYTGFEGAVDVCDEKKQLFGTALSVLISDERERTGFEKNMNTAFSSNMDTELSVEAAGELFSDTLSGSISKLETYGACAYRFFMRYGLGLNEREKMCFDARNYGNLLHSAMENLAAAPDDIDGCFDRAKSEFEEKGYFEDAKSRFLLNMLRQTFTVAAQNVSEQLKQGEFSISEVECGFKRNIKNDAVNLFLTGKIDRIDTCVKDDRVLVRVVDYKSGEHELKLSDIYYGISLQLPVYMMEALAREKEKGHDAYPAGMFYYRIKDPVIDAETDMTDKEIADEVRKELLMQGAYLGDEICVNAMDATGSEVFKREKKKTELSKEEFESVEEYSDKKLLEHSKNIISGRIKADPYRRTNGKTPCDYCEFSHVCMHDPEDAAGFRKLKKLDRESVLELMRGNLKDGKGMD